MNAFTHTARPATRLRLSETLSSADTPGMRAARIVHLMGLSGDPRLIERHFNVIADCLEQYAAVDKEARK